MTKPAKRDLWVAGALFVVAFTALLLTEREVGFVRDEGMYFAPARAYAGWFQLLARAPGQALSDGAITQAFSNNPEHPVLMKSLFALSYLAFHEGLGLRPALSMRLPAFGVAALIPALLFLLGTAVFGRRAGLFAALSFFLVPRQFFNAHLACFDVPVAAMWLLVVYTFWRAQHEPRFWLWCGVAFGLAIATKHNALFLPFVLGPFAFYRAFAAAKVRPEALRWAWRFLGLYAAVAVLYGLLALALEGNRFQESFILLSPHSALFLLLVGGSAWILFELHKVSEETFRPLATFAAMAALGPLIFYIHWPYLWYHPVERTAWYLAFHARHEHYAWFYLGTLMRGPPFPLLYVVVKTALTVPTSLFVPMVAGLIGLVCRWRKLTWTEVLMGVNALASIAIISHPEVPHFGGVKHWFPSMVFLAMLAGESMTRAGDFLAERLRRPNARNVSYVALSSFLFLPALIGGVRIHPYGTSYYSELAGGVPGAATLGMQRQFWSNNVTGVLPWINEHAPRHARVWLHEVHPLAVGDYRRNGMLREDLRPVSSPDEADVAAYQYHQEFREQEFNIWQAFGTRRPVTGLYIDETPQVIVYQRPSRQETP